MKKTVEKKNVVAAVKSLVSIKNSLYLCIPKVIARQCGLNVGDPVTIVAQKGILKVILPED